MSDAKRLLMLLGIMAGVAVAVAGLSMWTLYEAAFEEQRVNLSTMVSVEAQAIEREAVRIQQEKFDYQELSDLVVEFARTQQREIFRYKTGDFVMARLVDGMIEFIVHTGSTGGGPLKSVPYVLDSLAQPMRLALDGKTGTVIARDYRGEMVLAAYQPIGILELGIVAKIDLAEVRAPFVNAGIISGIGALLVILMGTALFRRISSPLVENLEIAVNRLTEAQRVAKLGNWERDIASGESWWSEETYHLFGMEPATTGPSLGTFFNAIHPEDRKMVQSAIDRCMAGKEPYSIEYRIILPDGALRTIYGRGTWRLDADGNPARISGTVQDITRRRQTEEKVRRLAAAIEGLNENFALYGADDRLILCNEGYRNLNKGIPAATTLGTLFEDHVRDMVEKGLAPDSIGREENWIQERMERHRNPGEPFEMVRQDGTWLLVHEQRVADGSTAIISTDITKRKQAEENLRNALIRAEEGSKAKSVFLANMSHELRTPLNSIIGFSETIKAQMFGPIGNAKYQEYAEDINASGTHLLEVISDILDISKIEAGGAVIAEDSIDLPELVDQAFVMLKERADNNGVILSRSFLMDCPMLRADPRHIKQIVINLVTNAVKFTPNGGKVSLDISLGLNQGILITIQDTGVGIEAKDIEKVLEPFEQVGDIYSRTYEGTGLGLPLAKSLVELYGGHLNLESTPGKGTSVTIGFPPERTIFSEPPLAVVTS